MKNRVLFIDCLRIFAIFGVIMIHVTAECMNGTVINTLILKNNFMNALVHSYSVPLFIVISGYLLLDNKNYNYKSMLKKYLPRIILCLLFWHYVYYFYEYRTFNTNSLIRATKNLLLGKTYSHLWYLYLVIGLYLLTPILKKLVISLNKKDFLYTLILGFTITSLLPTIGNLAGIDLSIFIVPYKVLDFSIFLFYYLLGHYLKVYEVKYYKYLLIISTVCIIIFSAYGNYISIKNNTLISFLGNSSIFGLLFTISIFSLFKNLFSNKENKYINKLGELTFGVYLVHFIVEKTLLNFGISANIINPLFGSIIVSIIILIISYLICFIINKIPCIRKIIL